MFKIIVFTVVLCISPVLAKQEFFEPVQFDGSQKQQTLSVIHKDSTTYQLNHVNDDTFHNEFNRYQYYYFVGQLAHGYLFSLLR